MRFDEPKYLPGGDHFILVQFGDDASIDLNFMALGLTAGILNHSAWGLMLFVIFSIRLGLDALSLELGASDRPGRGSWGLELGVLSLELSSFSAERCIIFRVMVH